MSDLAMHIPSKPSPARYQAFTLIELMVSVAILVLVILSVGVVFQSASKAVGMSQSTLELLSNVRAVQRQFSRDLAGIDKNGFLVIRSRKDATLNQRYDQLAFISVGTFPNRTGVNNVSGPMIDKLTASAAVVWYGQLAIQTAPPVPAAGNYLAAKQDVAVPLNALPSGSNETDFILGRHATLLLAPTGNASVTSTSYSGPSGSYNVYASPRWSTPAVKAYSVENAAQISCSRIDRAVVTPGALMQSVYDAVTLTGRAGNLNYEADNFCFRFAALKSPYDAEAAAYGSGSEILNAYFRMHPILLQGTSSFAVDWTDGTLDVSNSLAWFGSTDAAAAVTHKGDATIEPAADNSDDYQAIFSFDTRPKWPKALRIRFHVADPTGRLPGGRDFSEVINLP